MAAPAEKSLESRSPGTSTASTPRVVKRSEGWTDHAINLGPPDWSKQHPRRKMATYNEVDRQIARHGRPGHESSRPNMCVVLCAASKAVNTLRSGPHDNLQTFTADCEEWCASSHDHPKKLAHRARAEEYDAVLDMSAEEQREWRKRKAAAGWDDIIYPEDDTDAKESSVADVDSREGYFDWEEAAQAALDSMVSSFARPGHNGRGRGAWSPPPQFMRGRFAF